MKSIIKIIEKVMIIVVEVFFVAFFVEYSSLIVTGNWYFDIKEWWHNLLEYGTLRLMLSTIVFSSIIFLLCVAMDVFADTKVKLLISEIILSISVFMVGLYYLNYVEANCITLENSYIMIYGSIPQAKKYIIAVLLSVTLLRMIVVKIYLFVKNDVKQFSIKQILSMHDDIDSILYVVMPLYLVWPGMFSLAYYISFPWIWSFIIIVITLFLGGNKLHKYKKLSDYYFDALQCTSEARAWIVVNEDFEFNSSFFYKQFFCNNVIIDSLKQKRIGVLPLDIYKKRFDNSIFISLDVYDLNFGLLSTRCKEKVVNQKKLNKGIFCFAYSLWPLEKKYSSQYDNVSYNINNVINQIISIEDLLLYRIQQQRIIKNMQLDTVKSDNCIVSELWNFRRYYETNVNQFLVFDYSVKWLEIINYFYSLILLYIFEKDVTDVADDMKEATFGKWRGIRYQLLFSKGKRKELLMMSVKGYDRYKQYKEMIKYVVDDSIIDRYRFVWNAIGGVMENKSWVSKGEKATIEDLLGGLVFIRDYTRGHGVFTFEINPQVNLSILEILVYLTNHLVHFDMLNLDQELMKEKGWIIFQKETPYFCYSFDRVNKSNWEYVYNSFSCGTSILIPDKLRREANENI